MNLKKVIYKNNKLLNSFRLLGDYSFQPFFLLFHLTLDCNCSCINCYQIADDFYQSKNGTIMPSDFEKIIKDAKKSFLIKPAIHFFGGEPLLNPHFMEIVKITEKYDFRCSLTTNGILLSRYLDCILQNRKLDQLNISLDDIGVKHDSLRNFPGSFEAATSSINQIREMEKKNKLKKRKIININCIINSRNYDHLFDVFSYYSENNIDIDMLVFQHQYGGENNYNIKKLKDQISKLKEAKASFEIAIIPNVDMRFLDKFYVHYSKKISGKCPVPWIGLNIMPNLDVTPGGGVLGCNQVVGSLKEGSIKEIWNGKRMKEFRKKIIANGIFPACAKCCHARLSLKNKI